MQGILAPPAAVGLRVRDLYAGPPSTAGQARQAALERDKRSSAIRRLHWLHGRGCDELHAIEDQIENLGARLMYMADGPEADALTHEFHDLLDRGRRLEPVLQMIERGMRP